MEDTKQLLGPNKVEGYSEWLQLKYGQLYEFCLGLNESQLAQPVIIWGEKLYVTIQNIKDCTLIGYQQGVDKNTLTYRELRDYLEPVYEQLINEPVDVMFFLPNHNNPDPDNGEVRPLKIYYIEELQEDFVDDGDEACIPISEMEKGEDVDILYPKGSLFINTGE